MIIFTATLLNANGRPYDVSLGIATVINDGSGTAGRGNYNVTVKTDVRRRGRVRKARVLGFPRLSGNAWEILRRALNEMHEAETRARQASTPGRNRGGEREPGAP